MHDEKDQKFVGVSSDGKVSMKEVIEQLIKDMKVIANRFIYCLGEYLPHEKCAVVLCSSEAVHGMLSTKLCRTGNAKLYKR